MLASLRRISFVVVVALLALYPSVLFGLRLAVGVVVGDGPGNHGGRPAAALGALVFLGLTACLVRLVRRGDTVADAHAMSAYAVAAVTAQLIGRYSDGEGSIALFAAVALVLMPHRRRLLDVRPHAATLVLALAAAAPLLVAGVVRAHHVAGLKGGVAEDYYDAAWMMLTIALLLIVGALDAPGAELVRVVATAALALAGVDSLIAGHPFFLARPWGGYLLVAAALLGWTMTHPLASSPSPARAPHVDA